MTQSPGLVPATGVDPATGAGSAEHDLLQSVVDTARAIFGAAASSVLLHDRETDELVFQAVAGEERTPSWVRGSPQGGAWRAGCSSRVSP